MPKFKFARARALAVTACVLFAAPADAGPIRKAACAVVEKVKETRAERKAHRSSGVGCGKGFTKIRAESVHVAAVPTAPAPCKDCQR